MQLPVQAFSWSSVSASQITKTGARIDAFFDMISFKSGGFYIGIAGEALTKVTKNLNGEADGPCECAQSYYYIGKNLGDGRNYWYGELRPNTTYNYKIFLTQSDNSYQETEQKSFTTLPAYITASYNANGGQGTMANSAAVKYNEALTRSPNVFTRRNYAFLGWNVKRSVDNTWYVSGRGWQTQDAINANGYQKKLYSDGGSDTLDFSWYRKANNSNEFYSNDFTITFYAVWEQVARDVTLDANGGSCDATSITVPINGNYGSLPTPTRSGYLFDGWFVPGTNTEVTAETNTQGVYTDTLEARWTPDMVAFDPNGGNCSTTTMQVVNGSLYGSLPIAQRTGFRFIGWFDSANGGNRIAQYTTVTPTSPRELYAQWQAKTPKVTLNPNGGNLTEKSKVVTYGAPYGTLPVPKKAGYRFAGWMLADSGATFVTESSIVATESNHTLIAQWQDRAAESVAVDTMPRKTDYEVGDTLDTAGLALRVLYDNGEEETVRNGFSCSPTTLSSAGDTNIAVSCAGVETQFTVHVTHGAPVSVSVVQLPNKTEYLVGESLDLSGLQLLATYRDGSTQVITDGFSCTPALFSGAGPYRVTVIYDGASAQFAAEVSDREILRLEVTQQPDRKAYYAGEFFDPTGMVVTAVYDDETRKTVEPAFSSEPLAIAGTAEQAIALSYGGKTTFVTVTVAERPQQTLNLLHSNNASGRPGDMITIPVALENNPGLIGFELLATYDPFVLTPVTPNAAQNGELVSSLSMDDGTVSDVLKIGAYGTGDELTADGNLAYVSFYIREDADASQTTVRFSGSSFNSQYQTQPFAVCESAVCISGTAVPRIVLPTMSVQAGESFYFPVELRHFAGYSSYAFSITYDADAFDYLPTQLNGATISDNEEGMLTIESNLSAPITQDHISITLRFSAANASAGSAWFMVANASCGTEEPAVLNGKVTVLSTDEGPLLSVESQTAYAGDTISIPICLSDNSGVASLMFLVEYDSCVFAPLNLRNGNLLETGEIVSNIEQAQGDLKCVWAGTDNVSENGVLAIMDLQIYQNTLPGNYTITVICEEDGAFNETGGTVRLRTQSATVTVRRHQSPLLVLPAQRTVEVNDHFQMIYSCNFAVKTVCWSNDNEEIATVDDHGRVTALKKGSTVITVTCTGEDDDGNPVELSAKMKLIVKEKAVSGNDEKKDRRDRLEQRLISFLQDAAENLKRFLIQTFIIVGTLSGDD